MKKTAPEIKTLGEPAKVRLFKVDEPLIKDVASETGMDRVELTRRAIHVGLPLLAQLLGVDIVKSMPKKAA